MYEASLLQHYQLRIDVLVLVEPACKCYLSGRCAGASGGNVVL